MNDAPNLLLVNDGKHANLEYLSAIMTWPDDFSKGNFLTEASIKNLADSDCDTEKASILRDRNKEVKKALWPGFVAGKIFTAQLCDLSLGKAQFLAAKTMDRCVFDGQLKTLSVDSARNHWRKYKRVAHLWAAYSVLQGSGEENNYNLLVQLAGRLLEMAIDNGSFANWEPIIVETDLGPFNGEISIPSLPEHSLDILKEYEPHSKL